MPGSASNSPGVVWDDSVSVIRRSNRPRRKLVGSNNGIWPGGLRAKDKSNGSWEEEAEEREGDVRQSG
jgi:hypothetical protein